MSKHSAPEDTAIPPAPPPRRPRLVRWLVVATTALTLVAGALWILATALLARPEIASVRVEISQLQAAVNNQDVTRAQSLARQLETHARKAHRLTTGPAWAIAAKIPYFGRPLQSVRGLSTVVDELGQGPLPTLVRLSQALSPSKLRLPGGQINVLGLATAAPGLHIAVLDLRASSSTVAALPHSTWFNSVDRARQTVADKISSLTTTLAGLDRAAQIAPPMLGQSGKKIYFLGLMNEAEARGLGGIPGAFAIIEVDHGAIKFLHFGNDDELFTTQVDVNLGPDYQRRYAKSGSTSLFINSDISPHFPDAAAIWSAMWKKYSGQRIDGAIATDPTTLSYLLKVTGPAVGPQGELISADNIVSLTQSTLYARFSDQAARKAFLIQVATAAQTKILGGGDTAGLIKAANRAVSERRLMIWSADTAVEAKIAGTSLGGIVARTTAPFAGFVVVNAGANKLDYYLERAATWTRSGCGATRSVTATIELTNTAPASGLSPYVSQRADQHAYPVQPGDQRLQVSYLATTGAELTGLTVQGKPGLLITASEQGHPTYLVDVELPRGESRTLTFTLREPQGTGPLVALKQPLVHPLSFVSKDQACP